MENLNDELVYVNEENLEGDNLDGLDSEPKGDGTDPKPDETPEEKKFTQADLERMIGERLARDRKKREEEAEKQRLIDEAKYKDLYEAAETEKQALLDRIAQAETDRLKTELIVAAGYPADKVDFIKSITNGSDETEIRAALDVVMKNVPPTPNYVDPNPGNGHRNTPPSEKDSEYGKSLYDRIKKK